MGYCFVFGQSIFFPFLCFSGFLSWPQSAVPLELLVLVPCVAPPAVDAEAVVRILPAWHAAAGGVEVLRRVPLLQL